MSVEDGPAVGTFDVPVEPWRVRLRRWFPPLPTLGVVIAVAAVVMSLVPGLRVAHWSTIVVVAGAVVAVGLAAPTHVDAVRSLRGPLDPIALASLTALIVVVWSLSSDVAREPRSAFAAAVVGALVAITGHVRRASGDHGARGAAPATLLVVVVVLVLLAAGSWTYFVGAAEAWTAAVAVLVGAGTCSLVLAHTVPTLSAQAQARKQGVHIVNQADLARLASIDTVVMQQDGTITTGRLKVDAVQAVERDHDRNVRWFAGALSHAGDHPISRALAQLSGHGRLTEVSVIDGTGMIGTVDRHPVRVGDPSWLGLSPVEALWRTVAVEVDARVLGTVTVADELRDHAPAQVALLTGLGIEVHVVSSSRPDRAEHLARVVGLQQTHTAPIGTLLESLQAEGRTIAAVSDQPVDAEVLLSSRIHDGVVRLDDLDVAKVGVAVAVARSAVATRRRAKVVAVVSGLIGMGVADLGFAPPGIAAGVAVVGAALTAWVARPSTSPRR